VVSGRRASRQIDAKAPAAASNKGRLLSCQLASKENCQQCGKAFSLVFALIRAYFASNAAT
jgi:hypothetical protein